MSINKRLNRIIFLLRRRIAREGSGGKLAELLEMYLKARKEYADTGKIPDEALNGVKMYLDAFCEYGDNPLLDEIAEFENAVKAEANPFCSSAKCNQKMSFCADEEKRPHGVSQPVLRRMSDGTYILASFVFYYDDEEIRTGLIRRPSAWIQANLLTGEIEAVHKCSDNEFSDASYEDRYDIHNDGIYDISKTYYAETFRRLDAVRLKLLNREELDKSEYKEYMGRVIKNIPIPYKRFFFDLSVPF